MTGPRFADTETTNQVLAQPVYQEACDALNSFLARSRSSVQNPSALLELQGDMAEMLLGLQSSQQGWERAAKDMTNSEESRAAADIGFATTRRLSHLVRQVADGIAWRLFKYDRASLYQLALKPQTGYLEEETINNEFQAAEKHAAQGTLVLLNDLTNFVRFGDLTLQLNDGPKILEIKSGKGSEKSGRASRQSHRLSDVAEFINAGIRQRNGVNQRLVRLATEPKTHLASVQELIRAARRHGSANARISDCVAVDIYHIETAGARSPEQRSSLLQTRHNPFSQSRKAITGNSLDLFYHFTPNRAPYSVFPWRDEDCSDVLSGRLWIIAYFNWDKLERTLKRRGLLVTELDRDRLNRFMSLPFEQQKQRNFDIGLAVTRQGGASCTVSFADFARLAYEFLDEQTFADAIEEVLEMGIQSEDRYFTAFANEDSIWN